MAIYQLNIEANVRQVLRYEDAIFKEKVQMVVPLQKLSGAAVKLGSSGGLKFHEHFIKEVSPSFESFYIGRLFQLHNS